MKVHLLAKDNALPGNREITQWLDANLETLVENGIIFDFKVLETKASIAEVIRSGVTKLPALVVPGNVYCGSIEIKNYLQRYLKAKVKNDVPDEEDIHNWQLGQMSKKVMEEEKNETEDDDFSKTKQKAENEWRRRQEEHKKQVKRPSPIVSDTEKRPDNIRPPRTAPRDEIMKAATGSGDDLLIARMLEET